MEFHISRTIREELNLDEVLFSFNGNVVFANVTASRKLAQGLNELPQAQAAPSAAVNAGALFAMGLIDELSHALVARYREEMDPAVFTAAAGWFSGRVGPAEMDRLLLAFTEQFPNTEVYSGTLTAAEWLAASTGGRLNREAAFEEMMLLWLANGNAAFAPFHMLFGDAELKAETSYGGVTGALASFFASRPPLTTGVSLLDALRAPSLASPDSLTGQLDYIRENWSAYLGEDLRRVLLAIDVLREEEVALWMRFHPPTAGQYSARQGGHGAEGFEGEEFVGFESEFVIGVDGVRRRRYATDYQAPLNEYEAFSADQAWMPTVVLIAKNTYVWLEQLSKKYKRHIHRLDQIPNEELQTLATRGMTGLWLIGLWERSRASKTIKRLCGNSDAVASAYSLKDYSIAEDLGGEAAYEDLRYRAARAGLRLASDMVPNHMGIDSDWVIEHPEWFVSRAESPFPVYRFEGPDLSTDSRVEIKIEDHYYDQTDAAVAFRLRSHRDGSTRFVYHGNDGTTFAWNDTAQLDYSKAEVREHVIQVILNVARRFPIIRFDAAMVLAKRHVQRLWFPLAGAGGAIPSRAEDAMTQEAFDAIVPHEFWREVVDRVAVEVPGTLLLAEAFWLLEGYFVRTLGMHRVYNSAFMNMLRDEENAKYRSYLKKTVEFDPDILKRYVNFMSNPDERTAFDQFGSGDKYFGVSVLLATLPGLPMFGHGQVEGFTERYGMDFQQARMDERPNDDLIAKHQHVIAPLLKNRRLFAESTHFILYDFWNTQGTVDENVFAYSNRFENQRAIVFYNNAYETTYGTIHMSVGYLDKATGALQQKSVADGLALHGDDSVVIAYRDTIRGLEYLRRARTFREQGMSMELRGYQHAVLLDWRELSSTAAQPWDRLCDSLNGAGVYSVDDEMSRLRLRPLVDALRQSVSAANVSVFAALGAERLVSKQPKTAKGKKTKAAAVMVSKATESTSGPAARLDEFVAKAHAFAETARSISAVGVSSEAVQGQNGVIVGVDRLVRAAIELPALLSGSPKEYREAARVLLPVAEDSLSPQRVWAPLLAWMSLQPLPAGISRTNLYDELGLRHALAETFRSVGLEGEATWRAAAQVRVLLKEAETATTPALFQEAFWNDGDVQWLAGVHEANGKTWFVGERLEELICWLQVPSLLAAAGDEQKKESALGEITAAAAKLKQAARDGAYEVRAFLQGLTAAHAGQSGERAKTGTVPAPMSEPAARKPVKRIPARKK